MSTSELVEFPILLTHLCTLHCSKLLFIVVNFILILKTPTVISFILV